MRSDFEGIAGFFKDEEGSSRNMSHLFGLSDFWHIMFEDTEKINLLMEANAISASDVYSKFLQLTSSITLEDVQATTGSQLKLLILSKDARVTGSKSTYKLPGIQNARYVVNRPFLPTVSYEQGAHFTIDIDEETISFFKDPFEDKFPLRKATGTADQIAMWMVDAEIDEKLMATHFGRLLDITTESSTERFQNFLYGLFYLYSHGPDLAQVRRGLNVALGVPLARDNETILSIRKSPDAEQYFVITDLNAYLLPYGLKPSKGEGETLKVGDEVTTWVEVKDYVNDGDWWINLEIPKSLMPYVPDGQPDSYAKPGSYADYLMRNYLKHHTFLVKVNVTSFKNVEVFQELGSIIRRVKPTYTAPIYIWAVPLDDEKIEFRETNSYRIDQHRCEYLTGQIKRMRRNSLAPLDRCCPLFIRTSIGQPEAQVLGLDPGINGLPFSIAEGTARGFINRVSLFRDNTTYEKALLRNQFHRSNRNQPHNRNMIAHMRTFSADGLGNTGLFYKPFMEHIGAGMRCVPLYVTVEDEFVERMFEAGVTVPTDQWAYTLMRPVFSDGPINEVGINEGVLSNQFDLLVSKYSSIFFRSEKGHYGASFIPDTGRVTFAPAVTSLKDTDYLFVCYIYEKTLAVYWVTSSSPTSSTIYPFAFPYADPDVLKVTGPMPFTRGMAPSMKTAVYSHRSGTLRSDSNGRRTRLYTDVNNSSLSMTRGGVKIQTDAILDSDSVIPR